MNKELNNLQDIKSAFISHCKELDCDENYIKVCEIKFSDIEKALKEREIIKMFIKSINLRFEFVDYDKLIIVLGGEDYECWYYCKTQEEYDLLKEVLK